MVMRRFAGILLTVATLAAAVFTFASGDAGASKSPARHHATKGAPHLHVTAADRHLCTSMDRFIEFLRHAPRPSDLKSHRGRVVLHDLNLHPPAAVQRQLAKVVHSFAAMRDHGPHALTKAEDKATSQALFEVAVYGATRCSQQRVRAFGSSMVQSRIAKAEASTTTTTTR